MNIHDSVRFQKSYKTLCIVGGVSRENTEDGGYRASKQGVTGNASMSNTSQVSPRSQYHQTHNNPFNQTGASIGHHSSSTNTANIKGKIVSIEEMIRSL